MMIRWFSGCLNFQSYMIQVCSRKKSCYGDTTPCKLACQVCVGMSACLARSHATRSCHIPNIYIYIYMYICMYISLYVFFYLMQFNFALSMRGLNIRLYLGPLYIPPLDATNANDLITLSFYECVLMYWCTVKPNDAANCPAILSCILNISLLLANAYFFSSSLSALRWRTSVLSAFKHHYHPCALI